MNKFYFDPGQEDVTILFKSWYELDDEWRDQIKEGRFRPYSSGIVIDQSLPYLLFSGHDPALFMIGRHYLRQNKHKYQVILDKYDTDDDDNCGFAFLTNFNADAAYNGVEP